MATSNAAGKDAPLIATPTTTVQKRMLGRTPSTDFRTISDLRYPNMFCTKEDYPEVKMTDIAQIAEQVIATKLRWPGVPVLCNKRDIDAAFKRVRAHPDASVILCTEFNATLLGCEATEQTIVFLYLALSCGWMGSPWYFSKIGEGFAMAHRDYSSGNPNRDGTERFDSHLFAGDAIFAEPTIWKRKEMVISRWGHVCRRLPGQGAANGDKLELEGVWSTTHIILGFEVNVEGMTIKLPPAKKSGAWDKINHHMFEPGNRVVTLKKVQDLPGVVNRW